MEAQESITIAAAPQAPPKAQTVKRLLSRRTGATMDELGTATGWQPHTIRAFLSGLRKKGSTILREERRNGAKAYRIAKAAEVKE